MEILPGRISCGWRSEDWCTWVFLARCYSRNDYAVEQGGGSLRRRDTGAEFANFLYQKNRGADEGKRGVLPAILVYVKGHARGIGHLVQGDLVCGIAEVIAGDKPAKPYPVNNSQRFVAFRARPLGTRCVGEAEYIDVRRLLGECSGKCDRAEQRHPRPGAFHDAICCAGRA